MRATSLHALAGPSPQHHHVRPIGVAQSGTIGFWHNPTQSTPARQANHRGLLRADADPLLALMLLKQ